MYSSHFYWGLEGGEEGEGDGGESQISTSHFCLKLPNVTCHVLNQVMLNQLVKESSACLIDSLDI